MVHDFFKSLDRDKGERLEDIECGDNSSASFLACVEAFLVKLDIYKRFSKSVEFYMEYVMLEVDFYLSLGRVRTV